MEITVNNTTPWDTDELTEFLSPLAETAGIPEINVELLRARPGTKRERQRLYRIEVNIYKLHQQEVIPTSIIVRLISPKRVAARTDLLERMSQIESLDPHETALPEKILGAIAHAFEKLACMRSAPRKTDTWDYHKHFTDEKYSSCKCDRSIPFYPLIRGDMNVKTAAPVSLKTLKQRGRWALESAENHRKKMEEKLEQAAKLGERIRKLEAKA